MESGEDTEGVEVYFSFPERIQKLTKLQGDALCIVLLEFAFTES